MAQEKGQDETMLCYEGPSILWLMDPFKNYPDTMTYNQPKVFTANDPLMFSTGCIDLQVVNSKGCRIYPSALMIASVDVKHCNDDDDSHIQIQLRYDPSSSGLWGEEFHKFKYVNVEVALKDPCGGWTKVKPSVCKTIWPSVVECACGIKTLHVSGKFCAFSFLAGFIQEQNWIDARNQTQELITNYQYFIDSIVTLTLSMKEEDRADLRIEGICTQSQKDLGKKMLFDGLYADFTLRTADGKLIKCHKSVLAGQSEVLAAMLQSRLTEDETDEWFVEDMNYTVALAFLKFLYYGNIEDAKVNGKIAFELLRAGHKYMVKSLENVCKEILFVLNSNMFDASTALEIFAFCGNVEGLQDLRGVAVRAFQQNASEFQKSGELETILVTHPSLAAQLLVEAFKSFKVQNNRPEPEVVSED